MILKKEYEWVLKILNSSINIYQIKTSENLFNAFINKWDDEISDEEREEIIKFLNSEILLKEFRYSSHRYHSQQPTPKR